MTTRFSLLEIDDNAKPEVLTPAQAKGEIIHREIEQQMKGEAKHGGRLDGVDLEARSRAIAVDQALQGHLAFNEPTFFAWGTRGSWGDKAARARAELHAMPLHSELASMTKQIVAGEKREGRCAEMPQLAYAGGPTIDDIVGPGPGFSYPCSPQAMKQLMSRAGAPGGTYLSDDRLPAGLRAPHVNHWLRLRYALEKKAHDEAHASWCLDKPTLLNPNCKDSEIVEWSKREPKLRVQQAKILTKLDPAGRRAAYGVVGPRFPHAYGMDRVIADVSDMFPSEARGSLFYDSSTTRWRVDAAVGAEFEPVVGDVYRLGVRYGAHDAGGGSYYADLYGIRVRCVNFTKIHGLKRLGRVRHVGSVESLQARIRDLVGHGTEAMHAYAEAVRDANTTAICERALAGDGDARAVFAALIEGGYLPAPDGPEIAASRYFDAWLKEPGHNRIDFVNAATRAAHEASWASPWVTEEIEDAAGKLLYQHLVLTEKQIEVRA